jgi:hypothetical protein
MLYSLATDWTAGVRFPAGVRDIYLLHSVQTSSETHPSSYPMGTGGGGGERVGSEPDHSPPSSAEVKDGEAILHPFIRSHGGGA